MSLEPGAPAPDFTLPTAGGGSVTLSELRGKPVVVYFYPKADTPGCTKQACGFSEALDGMASLGVTVIGISKDKVAKLDTFAAKYGLKITLASDEENRVIEAYGAWVEKSMYGKTYMGIDRSTFLVKPDGTLANIWRKVKVKGHVEAVVEAINAL